MARTHRNKPQASRDSLTGERIWLCSTHQTEHFQRNSGRMSHKTRQGKDRVFRDNCPCCNNIQLKDKKKITHRADRRRGKNIIQKELDNLE